MLSNTLEENSRVGGKLTSNAMFVWKNTTTVLIVDKRTTMCRRLVSNGAINKYLDYGCLCIHG